MLKRGIVSYRNRGGDELEDGGEKAMARKALQERLIFQEEAFGATEIPVLPFLESQREYMAARGRPSADLAAQVNPLDAERKYRIFEHELAKYMCMVVGAQIWVVGMDNDWEVVDVLLGSDEVFSEPDQGKRKTARESEWGGEPVARHRDLYHKAEAIECFDVAQASKDIVTYSTLVVGGSNEQRKCLVVYGLQDQGYLNGVDAAVTQQLAERTKGGNFERPGSQHLRWCEYWRCGEDELALHGFINTISISSLGDVLFLGGNQCLSVWPRDDAIATHSFTMHLYYAQELPKNIYAHQLKQENVGQIIQSEFSRDGRAVITLEVDHKTRGRSIKVWYNNNAIGNASEVDKKEERLSKEGRKDRMATQLFLLDLVSLEGLDCFELPGRRGTIQYFKQQPMPLTSRQSIQPITFLAVTESCAHLWSEDMNLPPDYAHQLQMHAQGSSQALQAQGALRVNDKQGNQDPDQMTDGLFTASSKYSALTFSCVHSFAQPQRAQAQMRNSCIRACFLSASQLLRCQAYRQVDRFDKSPILNTRRLDQVVKWKMRQALKIFDGMDDEAEIGQRSLVDYVVMASGRHWWLWEVKGIRSLGQMASQGPQVRELIQSEIKIDGPSESKEAIQQYFHPCHLFLGAQDEYETASDVPMDGAQLSDGFKLYCLSPSQAILKLSSSMARQDHGFSVVSLRQSTSPILSTQIVFKQVARNVSRSEEPLLAILKEQKHRTYLELFSATDLSRLTTERNARQLGEGLRQVGFYTQSDPIKAFKWVPELAQLVVLSHVRGGELQLRLVSSAGLCESLKSFAGASEAVELGRVSAENKTKMPLEGLVLIKGDDGEAAALTLSPADSEQLVDYDVSNCELKRGPEPSTIKQTIDLVLYFHRRIQFHQMTVMYRQSEREGPTARVSSHRLWTKELEGAAVAGVEREFKMIGKVLASRPMTAKGKSDELAYAERCVAFKSLLLVLNARSKWEVSLFEVDLDPARPADGKLSISWSQEIPGQAGAPASGSNAPASRVDPRGNPISQPAAQASHSDLDLKPLEFTLEAQITDSVVSLLIQNKKKRTYHLHLLAHSSAGQQQARYRGQIDLLPVLDFGSLDRTELVKHGLCLTHCGLDNGLIALAGLDRIYLLGEDQLTHEWRLVHTLGNALRGMDVALVKSLRLVNIGEQRQTGTGGAAFALLVNDRAIHPITQGLQQMGQPSSPLPEQEEPCPHLSHLAASLSRARRLHSTASLCNLFIQGKTEFVLKLLVKMHATITKEKELVKFKLAHLMKLQDTGVAAQEPSLLELFQVSLKEVLADIDEYVAAQVVQQDEKDLAAQRGDTKARADAFGDFFGGDDDDDDSMGGGLIDFDNIQPEQLKQPKRKDAAAKKPGDKDQQPGLDQQFAEIKDELLKSIALFATEGDAQSEELLRFVLLFASVYAKDFFSDEMASTLLRQVYLETERVDEAKIKELKEESRSGLDGYLGAGQRAPERVEDTKAVKVLDAGEIYAQVYGEDTREFQANTYQKGGVDFSKLGQWDSRKCALALFSVNQDVIWEELQDRFEIQSRASWQLIRDLCLPVWLKDSYKLRPLLEWIAKAAYKNAAEAAARKIGDGSAAQSNAEATSLWYVLMNKKPVLISLYEKEKAQGGDKVAQLLSQDFSQERWKKAASKNALALRAKQRYLLCATFFILGGAYESALQIVVDSMRDPILGVLTCRMLLLQRPGDSSIEELLHKLYQEHFVERGKRFGDAYLESMGLWGQKRYVQAVNALEARCDLEARKECLGVDEMFAPEGSIEVVKGRATARQERGAAMPSREDCLPVLSEQVGFELLGLVAKLKKAPLVTHALKKESSATGYGADGGDILADFFGGDDAQKGGSAAREDVKEGPEEIKLEVKDSRILNQVLDAALRSGDLYQALFTLRENRELVDARDEAQGSLLRRVASRILGDQILEIGHNPTFLSSTGSFEKQIEALLDFMVGTEEEPKDKLKNEPVAKEKKTVARVALEVGPSGELARDQQLLVLKSRLRRAVCAEVLLILEELHSVPRADPGAAPLVAIPNQQSLLSSDMLLLRYELELRLDARERARQALLSASSGPAPSKIGIPSPFCDTRTVIARIERQTFVFLDFIRAHTANPFLEPTNRLQHSANLYRYRQIILELEQHVDCMIIWDHWEDVQDVRAAPTGGSSSIWTEDLLEMWFYGVSGGEDEGAKKVDAAGKEAKSKAPAAKFDMFDDLMGGDDDSDSLDLMDMDFSAPQPPRPAAKKAAPAAKGGSSSPPAPPEELAPSRLPEQSHRARLCSKLRTSLVMHLTLLVLAYLTNKFYICKDILSKEDLGRLLKVHTAIKQVHGKVAELDEKLAQTRGELAALLRGAGAESGIAQVPGPRGQASTAKVKQEIEQLEHQRAELAKELESQMKQESGGLHFQGLKTHILKFKCAIEKKLSQIQELRPQDDAQLKDGEDEDNWQIPQRAAPSSNFEENLYQDKWETWLLNEEVQAAGEAKELGDVSQNPEELSLGVLSKRGQIVPESYQFMRMWLRFIIINSTKQALQEWLIDPPEAPRSGLAAIIDCQLELRLQDSKAVEGQWAGCDECLSRHMLCQEIQYGQQILLRRQFSSLELLRRFTLMSRQLEDQCTLLFQSRLDVIQRLFVGQQVRLVSSPPAAPPYLLRPFFKNLQKANDFWTAFQVAKKYSKPLCDQYLTLLGTANTARTNEIEMLDKLTLPATQPGAAPDRGPEKLLISPTATQILSRDLLGAGIELFKQRSEQISDFAFDNSTHTDNIALGLMTSGIREFPVVNTLRFRNRIENGQMLIDEENLKWEECLHRYDQIEEILNERQGAAIAAERSQSSRQIELYQKDGPIIMAIDSLYAEKSIFSRCRPIRQGELALHYSELKPPEIWNGTASENYLAQSSKLGITHEDPSYAVESHPHLPLYVTGNRKGILCTWRFGQAEDKSLSQFMPEIDPRQADIRRACIKKIMFNQYGDKIMSNNMEGSFTIYQVECHSKNMRKVPIFSLYDNVDSKVSDFDLVNSDNIVCTISQKQKTVKIYDTLLPYCFGRQAQVMDSKLKSGGNMVLCNQRRQVLYVFNARTGAVTELDMRKNLIQTNQYQLSQSHEVTAACLSPARDSLITGYKDGHVKIHRIDTHFAQSESMTGQKDLPLREKITAFPFDFRGKKGQVTSVKINQKSGGLFASSQAGVLKLLRTSV